MALLPVDVRNIIGRQVVNSNTPIPTSSNPDRAAFTYTTTRTYTFTSPARTVSETTSTYTATSTLNTACAIALSSSSVETGLSWAYTASCSSGDICQAQVISTAVAAKPTTFIYCAPRDYQGEVFTSRSAYAYNASSIYNSRDTCPSLYPKPVLVTMSGNTDTAYWQCATGTASDTYGVRASMSFAVKNTRPLASTVSVTAPPGSTSTDPSSSSSSSGSKSNAGVIAGATVGSIVGLALLALLILFILRQRRRKQRDSTHDTSSEPSKSAYHGGGSSMHDAPPPPSQGTTSPAKSPVLEMSSTSEPKQEAGLQGASELGDGRGENGSTGWSTRERATERKVQPSASPPVGGGTSYMGMTPKEADQLRSAWRGDG